MDKNEIRAGDSVRHKPSLETWFILGVNKERDRVCAAGWPPTEAYLSDCELVEHGTGLNEEERKYRDRQFGTNWDE